MRLDGKTIVFQGDSITDMARGRNTWDQNHLYGHSYVFLLASRLGYERPRSGIRIFNRGQSGDRCVDVEARWAEDTLALRPDIVSLLVGINDVLLDVDNGTGVDAERYAAVLTALVRQTRQALPGVRFVLCEPFAFPDAAKPAYRAPFTARVPQHQQVARRVAEAEHCLFVPLQEKFDEAYRSCPELGAAYWIWDGIHPTAAGQQIIARQWLRCVEDAGEDEG